MALSYPPEATVLCTMNLYELLRNLPPDLYKLYILPIFAWSLYKPHLHCLLDNRPFCLMTAHNQKYYMHASRLTYEEYERIPFSTWNRELWSASAATNGLQFEVVMTANMVI